MLKTHIRYIHLKLNSNHAKDLKFEMHFPCVASPKFGVAVLKIFIFGYFMAENPIWLPLFGHKMTYWNSKSLPKICTMSYREGKFQKFLACLLFKWMFLSWIFCITILKVLYVQYLQVNRDFQKIITHVRHN